MQDQNHAAARTAHKRRIMTRSEKQGFALRHIPGKAARGLEIGCNFQPLLRKSEGYDIQYLETTDTEGIHKRALAANMPASLVEPIDFVFDAAKSLPELTGASGAYDYVISSHVVEHIPNLVKHFQEVEAILKPGGKYIAIVPDKNFCFDVLKPLTTVGRLVDAFIQDAKHPPLASFIDELRYAVKVAAVPTGGWNEDQTGALEPKYPAAHKRIVNAIKNRSAPANWFGHTWAFTATSFAQNFCDLREFGLLELSCIELVPTFNMDFIAVLAKSVPDQDRPGREALIGQVRSYGYPEQVVYDHVPSNMRL